MFANRLRTLTHRRRSKSRIATRRLFYSFICTKLMDLAPRHHLTICSRGGGGIITIIIIILLHGVCCRIVTRSSHVILRSILWYDDAHHYLSGLSMTPGVRTRRDWKVWLSAYGSLGERRRRRFVKVLRLQRFWTSLFKYYEGLGLIYLIRL